jgi:hypothetical protein
MSDTEPKRRGRPPKAKNPEDLTDVVQAVSASLPGKDGVSPAQAYALRVWNGQSRDTLPRNERIARVRKALEGQGMSMEGVELP